MPGTTIGRGNVIVDALLGLTLTPTSVLAAITAEQSFPLPGIQPNDFITMNFNGVQTAGIAVEGARCAVAGTLIVGFSNATAGTLTPAAGVYLTSFVRAESFPLPTTAT